MANDRRTQSLTTVSAGAARAMGHAVPGRTMLKSADALVTAAQEGEAWRGWDIAGNSRTAIDTTWVVLCSAAHVNGTRLRTAWAETSDHWLVGHMGVADTTTGDKRHESYLFKTGFAWQGRRGGVGVLIGYSSAAEWRTRDPRPKNESLNAEITVGGKVKAGQRASVGLSLTACRYAQESDIEFMNALGSRALLYEAEGAGSHYARFSASHEEHSYGGHTLGASVACLWLRPAGRWTASATFRKTKIEKRVEALNHIPINHTNGIYASASVGAEFTLGDWESFALVGWERESRKLTRHVYDDGKRGYNEITSHIVWESAASQLALSIGAQRDFGAAGLRLSALASGESMEESLTGGKASIGMDRIGLRLGAETWAQGERLRGTLGIRWQHRRAADGAECATSSPTPLWKAEEANFALRSASVNRVGASARADVAVGRRIGTIFIAVDWDHDWRKRMASEGNALSVRAGVTL